MISSSACSSMMGMRSGRPSSIRARRSEAKLCYSDRSTGMARAVLTEIAQRLEALVDAGESSVIDLRSLPLTDADLVELDEILGHGEVAASIEVIGSTEVRETGYAGVWWVRHLGARGQVAAEEIAVPRVPEILCAQVEDVQLASDRLREHVKQPVPAGDQQEAADG